jgi:hypothetical protein
VKLATKQPFKEMVLSDSEKAAYRIGARNTVKLGQGAITKALEAQGGDKAAALGAMLNTEVGHSVVSGIMGALLTTLPQFQNDTRVQKLAEELRVNGMATLGNTVVDQLTEIVAPAMSAMVQNLPMVQQHDEPHHHHEEEEPRKSSTSM